MELRRDIADFATYRPPAWFGEYPALRINPKNPKYPAALAEALDVLKGDALEHRQGGGDAGGDLHGAHSLPAR
jgi:hypothetical protein